MADSQAFNGIVEEYEAFRPSYPSEIVAALVATVDTTAAPKVAADVGAGTGIFTRQLAASLPPDWDTVGIEPGADMIAMAQRAAPDLTFHTASAEDLPLPDQSVGLVAAAQAAQWFDRPKFYSEAKRVLAPGGTIAILQNNRAWTDSEFLDTYESLLEECSPGYSRHYRDIDFVGDLRSLGVPQPVQMVQRWTRSMSTDEFVGMSMSSTKMKSAVERLGRAEMTRKLDDLFIACGYEKQVTVAYATELFAGVLEEDRAAIES